MAAQIPFFIITPRGIEDIAGAEVAGQVGVTHVLVGYRRVDFVAPVAAIPQLLDLRCADDLFFAVAEWAEIGHQQRTLDQLATYAAQTDLRAARALCAQLRPLTTPTHFAISANFVGKRNYTTLDIKAALAAGVQQRHNWTYCATETAGALSLRLFIEHDRAVWGVRVGAYPLHRRLYRATAGPGALRPPVAAALARLVGAAPGVALLDPLCGAGTIVIEAALLGAQALGGDHDPAVLAIARANLAASHARATLRAWDATALPLPTASVECVATNLPFGRQVASADLDHLYRGVLREIARVLQPNGCAALLTTQIDSVATALADLPLEPVAQRTLSLQGQQPQVILVRATSTESRQTPPAHTPPTRPTRR